MSNKYLPITLHIAYNSRFHNFPKHTRQSEFPNKVKNIVIRSLREILFVRWCESSKKNKNNSRFLKLEKFRQYL